MATNPKQNIETLYMVTGAELKEVLSGIIDHDCRIMTAPDWVNCIKKSENKTWCGRTYFPDSEYVFLSIEHAANSVLGGHRLTPCFKCIEAVLWWVDEAMVRTAEIGGGSKE